MPSLAHRYCALTPLLIALLSLPRHACADWTGYAGDPQHSALSPVASQNLQQLLWSTPVDLNPQYSGNDLLIHYGSPVITAANTVIVPIKTGPSDGFKLNAFNGLTGALMWTQSTDYTLPQKTGGGWNWTPSYAPAFAPSDNSGTLFYAGNGGTIYTRTNVNTNGAVTPAQLAFYGFANYNSDPALFNSNIAVSTPITTDASGNIYFGYTVSSPTGVTLPGVNGGNPLGSGIARISSSGVGTFFQAKDLTVGASPAGLTQVATNSAPALSHDGNTIYVAMSSGNAQPGRLVALSASTLTPTSSTALLDPLTGTSARLFNDGTASPMVGPDGDVYFGVLDAASSSFAGSSRGWMEHYSGNLAVTKPTGAFGWDDTASVVPASMVPSYHGSSTYLVMTKFNNYIETGGGGQNMLAILDPNDTQTDNDRNNPTGATVMKEILRILGPTSNAPPAGSVTEWCINTAVVDPATDSILVNNEDGKLYRWDLSTNSLTQVFTLTAGLGEAYTPTLIGPDGAVYAVNNATLFAVGALPEPATLTLLAAALPLLFTRRRARLRTSCHR